MNNLLTVLSERWILLNPKAKTKTKPLLAKRDRNVTAMLTKDPVDEHTRLVGRGMVP
jgi:hypothetical protein